jgi:TAT (twin-arginine translocation) pathway signal sequence
MTMSRRNFLAWSTSVAVGAGLTACEGRAKATSGSAATTTPDASTTTATTVPASSSTAASTPAATTTLAPTTTAPKATDRVLVVVQLSGGNDGLNTLIPVTGRYHDLRPTLGIADDKLVKFPGVSDYGLHPSFAPLQGLLDAGRVAAVASVGYPSPNRSHFVSLDNWWSATPGKVSQTGWLGRYLDATGGTANDPLRAVALGSGVPALRGVESRATAGIGYRRWLEAHWRPERRCRSRCRGRVPEAGR